MIVENWSLVEVVEHHEIINNPSGLKLRRKWIPFFFLVNQKKKDKTVENVFLVMKKGSFSTLTSATLMR